MTLKFEFTEQEAQTILDALIKEPYGVVVDIINSLQKQAVEQMKPTPKQNFGVLAPDSDKAI